MFCAFNRRFDPSFKELQERVRAGEIGEVHVVKTVARDCPLPTKEYIKNSGKLFFTFQNKYQYSFEKKLICLQ